MCAMTYPLYDVRGHKDVFRQEASERAVGKQIRMMSDASSVLLDHARTMHILSSFFLLIFFSPICGVERQKKASESWSLALGCGQDITG